MCDPSRCTNCGKRHKRVIVQRPCYAARFCAQCKIHHSAREVRIKYNCYVQNLPTPLLMLCRSISDYTVLNSRLTINWGNPRLSRIQENSDNSEINDWITKTLKQFKKNINHKKIFEKSNIFMRGKGKQHLV